MTKSGKPIGDIRVSYEKASLHKADLEKDPFIQFERWFAEALRHYPNEANTMTLATVDAAGQPSARLVLLKDMSKEGFVFYTNYQSRKSEDLRHNNKAALLFYWPALEQQVRVEGRVEKVSEKESNAYFQSRPRDSQLGAWASPQSKVIQNRSVLTEKLGELEKYYEGKAALPKPPYWGGYSLAPHQFEFWQGRQSRLHDRFIYSLDQQNQAVWNLARLAP